MAVYGRENNKGIYITHSHTLYFNILQLLQASGREELYDDVLEFTKKTLRDHYKRQSATKKPLGDETHTASSPASSPSLIIHTTVRELAERELSLSKVRSLCL